MIAIKNAKIVLEHSIIPDGVLFIDGEKIVAYGKTENMIIPENCTVFDAQGLYVGPGFVDIHVHGGNGYMFSNEPENAAEHFLRHGETTVLATLYYDLEKTEFLQAIDKIKTLMINGQAGRNIGGFYMEGPYMNPKYGASPEKNRWRGKIREDDYKEIVERAEKLAKVWVIAPEREGIEAFVQMVKEINPDAVISVGHSEATPAQIRSLKKYGLRLQTHSMNATGTPKSHFVGTKTAGPDEACLTDKEMYAELICDSEGIHVSPDLIQMVLSVKGSEKVILISDSFVSEEKSPENLAHIEDLQFDANGNLCGSRLTLDVACRNIIKHTGCSINDAFLMASRNPAKVIGMDDIIGTVEAGKMANLVVVDDEFNVKKVMLQGKFIN